MVSYGNKYPRHNARPHVVEQSGQCARAHTVQNDNNQILSLAIPFLFMHVSAQYLLVLWMRSQLEHHFA